MMHDFERPNWSEQNRGIRPEFFLDAEGTEMVRIVAAGDRLNQPVVHVCDKIKDRFKAEYERWTRGEETAGGLSLESWGQVTPDALATFTGMGIKTVEELAAVPDTFVGRAMNGRLWRQRAMDWIASQDARKDIVVVEKVNAELSATVEALRRDNAELRAIVDAIVANGKARTQ